MTAFSLTSIAGFPGADAIPRASEAEESMEAARVRAAQGGCGNSFRLLVEAHQQRIYHFCFRYLRDAGDAREACQDVFIRAHRSLGSYRPKAKFSTWLFQIALNLCRDKARARSGKQEAALDRHALSMPCHAATPDEAAMRQADLLKLDRGLKALPDAMRAVLVLCCLEGFSHEESAAILKCSARAVEGRLYRARERQNHQ